MRNLVLFYFLFIGLAVGPLACNPSRGSRSSISSTGGGSTTGTPSPSAASFTPLDSGGGVLATFQADSSGNTAGRYLKVTSVDGTSSEVHVCEDSLLSCDLFEKARKVQTSNCNEQGCSEPTPIEPLPSCDENGAFSGEVSSYIGEVQALEEQKYNAAEEFIEDNEDTYDDLENKDTDAAEAIKGVSELHPCDLLAKEKEFIEALTELSADGEIDPELLAALVSSIFGTSVLGIATGVVAIQQIRKGRNPKEFVKTLKKAQASTKTDAKKAQGLFEAATVGRLNSLAKTAKARRAFADAKVNRLTRNFSNETDLNTLLKDDLEVFEFGGKKTTFKSVSSVKTLMNLSKIRTEKEFGALSTKQKQALKDNFGVSSYDDFIKKGGFREGAEKYVDGYDKLLTKKLDDLGKDATANAGKIKILKDAGGRSTEDLTRTASYLQALFRNKLSINKAKSAALASRKATIAKELNAAISNLEEFDKFVVEVEDIAEAKGSVDDLKEALEKVFGEDSDIVKALKGWNSKNTSLKSVAEAMETLAKKANSDYSKSIARTKAVVSKLGDIMKHAGSATKSVISDVKEISTKIKALAGSDDKKTPDQETLEAYVEKAEAFAAELLELSATQDSLEARIAEQQRGYVATAVAQ